jgi:nitroimidazol reductase NimA-like FMN-containing flavoprotein (pyridoxamine 5'-phosphate oxidase superfamily)
MMGEVLGTPPDSDSVVSLSHDESWAILSRSAVGRLAVSVAGLPDIFPVSHVAFERTLVFRTAQGTKLLELAANRYVAFEVDSWSEEEAVSVVVRGMATVVDRADEILRLDGLRLRSWAPTPEPVYVQIRPVAVTGRRMRLLHPAGEYLG